MRFAEARDYVVVPSFRFGKALLREGDPAQTAVQSRDKIGIRQIALESDALLAIAVEEKHGRGP